MKQNKPRLQIMQKHFATINVPIPKVGAHIGGKVQQNIEIGLADSQNGFHNACAIRMSYALHHSGIIIAARPHHWETVSGADKKSYIYRVNDLERFLYATFGPPNKTMQNPTARAFSHLKGLLIFKKRFLGATGHATLWDGRTCSDHCYFEGAIEAKIWLLQ